MEAFTDAVGLGMAGLGFGMVDVFDGQVELVFVVLAGPTVFRAAIGEDPQERNPVASKKGKTRSLSISAATRAFLRS